MSLHDDMFAFGADLALETQGQSVTFVDKSNLSLKYSAEAIWIPDQAVSNVDVDESRVVSNSTGTLKIRSNTLVSSLIDSMDVVFNIDGATWGVMDGGVLPEEHGIRSFRLMRTKEERKSRKGFRINRSLS